jgi:hypothetical protein
MGDTLPASVTGRVAKGEYGDLFNTGLVERAAKIAEPTGNWEVVRRGYVDGAAVEDALADPSGFATTRLHTIRRVLELESWLRAYFPSA